MKNQKEVQLEKESGEVVKFDGFLKIYRESLDDEEENADEFSHVAGICFTQQLLAVILHSV